MNLDGFLTIGILFSLILLFSPIISAIYRAASNREKERRREEERAQKEMEYLNKRMEQERRYAEHEAQQRAIEAAYAEIEPVFSKGEQAIKTAIRASTLLYHVENMETALSSFRSKYPELNADRFPPIIARCKKRYEKIATRERQLRGNTQQESTKQKHYVQSDEIMRERKLLTKSLRYQIIQRDGARCRICGRSPAEDGVKLHVDHIIPVSKGGKTVPNNLRTLCQDCNLGKGNKEDSRTYGQST